jgi:hypothetical protein
MSISPTYSSFFILFSPGSSGELKKAWPIKTCFQVSISSLFYIMWCGHPLNSFNSTSYRPLSSLLIKGTLSNNSSLSLLPSLLSHFKASQFLGRESKISSGHLTGFLQVLILNLRSTFQIGSFSISFSFVSILRGFHRKPSLVFILDCLNKLLVRFGSFQLISGTLVCSKGNSR